MDGAGNSSKTSRGDQRSSSDGTSAKREFAVVLHRASPINLRSSHDSKKGQTVRSMLSSIGRSLKMKRSTLTK